jgi:hypothetical protein
MPAPILGCRAESPDSLVASGHSSSTHLVAASPIILYPVGFSPPAPLGRPRAATPGPRKPHPLSSPQIPWSRPVTQRGASLESEAFSEYMRFCLMGKSRLLAHLEKADGHGGATPNSWRGLRPRGRLLRHRGKARSRGRKAAAAHDDSLVPWLRLIAVLIAVRRSRSGDHGGLAAAGSRLDLGNLAGNRDQLRQGLCGRLLVAGGIRLVALDIDPKGCALGARSRQTVHNS